MFAPKPMLHSHEKYVTKTWNFNTFYKHVPGASTVMDVVLSVPTCTVRTVLTPVSTSRSVTTYGLCIYTVLLLSTMFISHSISVCTYPSLKQYNTKSYPYYNSDIEHGTVGIEHGAVDTWWFLSCQSRTWRPWRIWRSCEDSGGIAVDIRWILVGHLVGLIR